MIVFFYISALKWDKRVELLYVQYHAIYMAKTFVLASSNRQHEYNKLNGVSYMFLRNCYGATSYKQESLPWRHNERDGVSNQQPHERLRSRLFGHRSKKTSKFRVTGFCAGNSPVATEFPAQMDNNAENVSIWWSHHCITLTLAHMKCCNVKSTIAKYMSRIDLFILQLKLLTDEWDGALYMINRH